ncbi:hypothetical protein KBZ20_16350 [Vulcanococcus limneticus Candia 3F8]|uniref:hypothetical protein n=1 Tax=Vulcanococcus limneticus TaxID=2170428 RepID=UPI0020CB70AC|nr:hypothetical protein [Vulcanococcus limneticus]MCP9793336.1 hypothetical protein [Vulcanococcus limneticus MW73D5]MCP9895338.1 hypothetical protein [Vulcanococcus limneticus Candia 3F8]MCP9898734.1 hypothetical protein [Vulcanococcus limneticus Candia 3B3]
MQKLHKDNAAACAGRIAGHTWAGLRWFWAQLDWDLIGDLIGCGLVTFAVILWLLGMALGRGVHRLNDALARAAVRLMVPTAEAAPAAPVAPAAPHPLILLATAATDQLQPLPVAELRRLGRAAGLPRALTHKGRGGQLLAILGGLEVAMA